MIQMHDNKLVAFHIYNKNDYSYVLDQGTRQDEFSAKQMKKRFLLRTVPTIVISY